MVTPSGWRSSLPTPLLSIKGKALSKAHKVVIKIGRKRCKQAWWMASRGAKPCSRSASSAKSIIMMAFFLTMPISNTMPITAIIPRSMPASIKANSAPTPADGKVDKMVMGWM